MVCFFACVVWCTADVSSVSPSSERTELRTTNIKRSPFTSIVTVTISSNVDSLVNTRTSFVNFASFSVSFRSGALLSIPTRIAKWYRSQKRSFARKVSAIKHSRTRRSLSSLISEVAPCDACLYGCLDNE